MKNKITFVLGILMFFALLNFSCNKEDKEKKLPKVTTADVTEIVQSSAKGGGNVTDDGNATTTRGLCWSTIDPPTLDDQHSVDGTGEGAFESDITGLAPSVTYYVRAYATNSEGTAFGLVVEFSTPLK